MADMTDVILAMALSDGGGGGGSVTGVVRYSVEQNLTDAQKQTARGNIGAVGETALASVYDPNDTQIATGTTVFEPGQHFVYNGLLFTAITAIDQGDEIVPDENAVEITADELIVEKADDATFKDAIASQFSESVGYKKGQFVWYNGILCLFDKDHPAGAWDDGDVVTNAPITDYAMDSVARKAAEEAAGAVNLVQFAQQPVEQKITHAGLTVVRSGNRITVNGTCTNSSGTYARFRMGGALAAVNGAPSVANNNIANGAVLDSTKTYKLSAKLVSGSATEFYITPFVAGAQNIATRTTITTGSATYSPDITGQSGIVLWFTVNGGTTFTNAVFEVELENATLTGETSGGYVAVTGQTPTVSATSGFRYVCTATYVTSLSFVPAATGICSVRFTSGTTPTVLTLPQTVKMPAWWTGCEASRTYEISIEDGVYGAVTSWA